MVSRYREAEQMHEAALDGTSTDWLKEHCLGLGNIKRLQGKFAASEALLQHAAEDVCSTDADDSRLWAVSLEQARLKQDMGDAATAQQDMVSLLSLMEARGLKPSRGHVPVVCVDVHPRQLYVSLVLDLAWVTFCSADWAHSLEWCRAALTMSDRLHRTGSALHKAVASAGAAASLMHLQRQEAAEVYARAAFDSLAAYQYKQDGLQTALFYCGVYSLLSGQFSHAKLHFDKALAVQHHVCGPDHPATVYLVAACHASDPPSVAPP